MIKIKIAEIKVKKNRSLTLDLPQTQLTNPAYVVDVLTKYIGDCDREHMVVITLDTKNNINCIHTASIGSLNSAICHPREIYKIAIATNAASIILGHNHPSGVTQPSKEDIATTKRIKEAGDILGIEVLDHVIVCEEKTRYYSFKENGLI